MRISDWSSDVCSSDLEQNDSPDQLYGKPATEFSARFIGTPPMNVLRLDDETRVLVTGTAQLGAHVPGDAAALGIRPEHIQLSADDGIPASVESVEYFGADSIIIAKLGNNPGVAVRAAGHLRAAHGDSLKLRWSPQQQHFFYVSGQALRQAPLSSLLP